MAKNNTLAASSIKTLFALSLAIIVGLLAIIHYADKASATSEPESMAAVEPQQVDVIITELTPTRLWQNFSGRLEAIDHVQIRPRVGGTITEVLFEEGAIVEKGTALFTVDPRPYKATLERARAKLEAAESDVRLAKAELDRAKSLIDKKVISKSRFDNTQNSYRVAKANVNAANAELLQAELNYEYAHITSPISGRVGRAEITAGNVVEAGPNAPVLTSVVSMDKLYVEFDVDEQTYLQTVRDSRGKEMPIELSLSGDDHVKYEGVIHAFDNQLDTTSGTIRARAILDNKDGALVPGMFANVRLGSAKLKPVLALTEKAIGTDQDKKYVYIVNEQNEVTYREVVLGRSIEGKRIIESGLTEGEKVLVNSLQRVRPGAVVSPVLLSEKNTEKKDLDHVAIN